MSGSYQFANCIMHDFTADTPHISQICPCTNVFGYCALEIVFFLLYWAVVWISGLQAHYGILTGFSVFQSRSFSYLVRLGVERPRRLPILCFVFFVVYLSQLVWNSAFKLVLFDYVVFLNSSYAPISILNCAHVWSIWLGGTPFFFAFIFLKKMILESNSDVGQSKDDSSAD
jgi:hypothetical protein